MEKVLKINFEEFRGNSGLTRFASCFAPWAVGSGDLDIVQFVEKEMGLKEEFKNCHIRAAMKFSEPSYLDYLLFLECRLDGLCFQFAAHYGNLRALQWLKRSECPMPVASRTAVSNACIGGHLQCLIWLLDNGFYLDPQAILMIAKLGHLEILSFLIDKGRSFPLSPPPPCPSLSRSIPSSNSLLFPFLFPFLFPSSSASHHVGYVVDQEHIYDAAAEGGQIEVLRLLRSRLKWPFTSWTARMAIIFSQADTLEWLHANHCPIDFSNSIRAAAQAGSMRMIVFLVSIGCKLDKSAMLGAVEAGRVEMMEALERRGCPIDDDMLLLALTRGRSMVARYLLDKPFTWKASTLNQLQERFSHHDFIRIFLDKNGRDIIEKKS